MEISVRTVAAQLERVETLAAEGRATRLEVTRMKGRLAETRAGLERAAGAADVARLRFLDLVGLPSHTEVALVEPLDRPLEIEAAPPAPDLAVARAAAEVRREQAEAATAPLWPQLSLVVGASYDHPNQRYFPPENAFNGSWDASVVLSWTVLDFGARRHAAHAARLEASQAARSKGEVGRRLQLAEASARAEVESALARVKAGRQAVAAAEESLRIATELFEARRLDATDLADRETELTLARAEVVRALADARVAEARVERVGRVRDKRPRPGR